VQHILIFDDHPESLRLVFGSATPEVDLSPTAPRKLTAPRPFVDMDHDLGDRNFVGARLRFSG